MFQQWTPLDRDVITIPSYKVLMNLVGLPETLWREKEVSKAVSRTGVYLGSVAPEKDKNLSVWTAVVTTDDLGHTLHIIVLVVGGLEYLIGINIIKWVHSLIYGGGHAKAVYHLQKARFK